MTSKVKWGVSGAILLLIAGMIVYPQLKNKWKASEDAKTATSAGSKAPRSQVLNINAEILKYQTLSDKNITTGYTVPDEEVDLSFESSGKIIAIYFKEGTHVKEGELLAKINDKPLQAQLKKLEAQVPLAGDRVFRQRTLLERDAVSQEAYEQVTTEYEKLMADIELVKANIQQTELRAPFDGIIGLRSVSEGAYVTPSINIVKLTKISPIKIEFSVPEKYASDVKAGSSIVFRLESSDGMMREHNAQVYAVESTLEDATRSLKARATFPNTDSAIKSGRYLSVEVTRREIKDALTVPSEAIIPELGKNIVYLYKNGVAQPVELVTGIRTESRVQVLDGLAIGDTLITTGVMQLRTGMKVSIDNLH